MPRYNVTLTDEERSKLQMLIQKDGKGYRIRHAQILLKLDKIPENSDWTYDRITGAYTLAPMTPYCLLFALTKQTSRWSYKPVSLPNRDNLNGWTMNTKETALQMFS